MEDTVMLADIVRQLNEIQAFLVLHAAIMPSKEWYTTAEVAAILGNAEFTVRTG